jgi:two-component system response regulator RpaA
MRKRKTGTDVFTTGEVARICRVSPHKVNQWFDSGVLAGFRLPSSKDRRFLRSSVVALLEANGMPAEWINDAGRKEVES